MALETSADSPAPLRQISTLIGSWIDRLSPVWIEAEIAQLTRRPGICFLTLRDLRATISIDATCHVGVLDASPAPIMVGARVVVQARPSFYAPRGSLALEVREIRLQGEGELLARLERTRQLLAAEGLFAAHHKARLPFLPTGVGLITGKDSAAERDVLENARRRWPDVRFVVRHSLMQGEGAARGVIDALSALDADPSVDVIIVARGGGSVQDLLPFSDEGLVRAVFATRTPVVSAIGHEPDSPILDLVADHRASTPTDAAKHVVPDVAEELSGVDAARDRLRYAVHAHVDREQRQLDSLRSRPVLARPSSMVDEAVRVVEDQRARARRSVLHRIDRAGDEIGHHLARVRGLSPLATLERGYAVAQLPDGSVVTRLDQVSIDSDITVRVVDGTLTARTLSVQETPHD